MPKRYPAHSVVEEVCCATSNANSVCSTETWYLTRQVKAERQKVEEVVITRTKVQRELEAVKQMHLQQEIRAKEEARKEVLQSLEVPQSPVIVNCFSLIKMDARSLSSHKMAHVVRRYRRLL